MSSEHFTLTISQSTSDNSDFAIFLKDRKRDSEHFLMHLKFSESIIVDDPFMDDIVDLVARCLAQKLLGQKAIGEKEPTAAEEESAEKIVAHAMEKMRRPS